MNKVTVFVNEATCLLNVCDPAAWAAQRLAAPLEFVHVPDRHPENAPVTDFSGDIGLTW